MIKSDLDEMVGVTDDAPSQKHHDGDGRRRRKHNNENRERESSVLTRQGRNRVCWHSKEYWSSELC